MLRHVHLRFPDSGFVLIPRHLNYCCRTDKPILIGGDFARVSLETLAAKYGLETVKISFNFYDGIIEFFSPQRSLRLKRTLSTIICIKGLKCLVRRAHFADRLRSEEDNAMKGTKSYLKRVRTKMEAGYATREKLDLTQRRWSESYFDQTYLANQAPDNIAAIPSI